MELVYLWVEDYKNIKKQGFNFSPRFHCAYDEESNELTIDKNDDYIPDFFGENINVTAIVGKNGSGKSSVLEYLSDSPELIVTFENDEFTINEDIEIINKTKYKDIKNTIELNSLYIPSSDFLLHNIDELDGYYSNSKPNQNNSFYDIFNSPIEEVSFQNEIIILRQLNMFLFSTNFINKIIYPKNIIFSVQDNYYAQNFLEKTDKKLPLSEEIYVYALYFMERMVSYSSKKNKKLSQNNNKNDSFLFANKVKAYVQKSLNKKQTMKEIFFNFEKTLTTPEYLIFFKNIKKTLQAFDKYTFTYQETGVSQKDSKKEYYISLEEFTKDLLLITRLNKILSNRMITFCWDINFSSGEKAILNIFALLFEKLKDNIELEYIYIDEGESFLHPNWQKKYISYIVQFLKDNFPNRKIHIILTSHSLFMLSDIPKQNIIFLDKDEKGNCKVVDGLKEKKQTFGANIHTLLSDSFFMENGLMGEFAKSKIDRAITLLNQEHLNEDELKYCEQIISIIGEPIVKNQLQRMLDSKRLSKIDAISQKIKDMSYELEILKEHQSKIVQDELRDKGKKQYKQRFEDD